MSLSSTITAIIRQRGQLTIPDVVRKQLPWAQENRVVLIQTTEENKIIIEPYKRGKEIDWKRLRQQIELVRSFKGKRGNLAKFIVEDRLRH